MRTVKQIHASSHLKVRKLQMRIAKVVHIRITGSPLCRGWPSRGLSRVMENYHARFLGGLGIAISPGYPVF